MTQQTRGLVGKVGGNDWNLQHLHEELGGLPLGGRGGQWGSSISSLVQVSKLQVLAQEIKQRVVEQGCPKCGLVIYIGRDTSNRQLTWTLRNDANWKNTRLDFFLKKKIKSQDELSQLRSCNQMETLKNIF